MITGQDAHGRPRFAVIDDDTGCAGAIDTDHIMIHEGFTFEAMQRFSIAAGGLAYIYVESTDKELHWKPSIIRPSVDNFYVEFYEDQTKIVPTALVYNPATRLGGIPPRNNNRGMSKTSSVIMGTVASPTIIGLPIAAFFLPGSTGVGQTRSGGESQASYEIDLKTDTAHIYKLYNGSASTCIVEMQFRWYELAEGV